MKLFELFSQAADWEWEEHGRDAGSAVFAIDGGFYRTFMQVITPKDQPNGRQDLFLDVAFEAMRFDGEGGMSMGDVDAGGYQFMVLTTVFEIVQDWFSKYGVKPVFAEATSKRARIYNSVLKRKGWRVEVVSKGSSHRIFGYPPGTGQ
ncbi:hypothetical protein D3C75_714140 [compost metagenome]